MKLLYISNLAGKKIGSFSLASIRAAKECGYDFHFAANFSKSTTEQMCEDERQYGIHLHHINFARNPFNIANLKAYREVAELINRERIDVIHCNTPIGGAIGRLAGRKRNVERIIYQAHGFHFFNGAPLKNWLLYYPIEWILAHFTDCIITINKEDYMRAQKFHLRKNGRVYYVAGVGIDPNAYQPRNTDCAIIRRDFNLRDNDVIALSFDGLDDSKKYEKTIDIIARSDNKRINLLLYCKESQRKQIQKYVCDMKLEHQVQLLDLNYNFKKAVAVSDIFLSTNLGNMEDDQILKIMAAGLPFITVRALAKEDYVIQGVNAYIYEPNDRVGISEGLNELSNDEAKIKRMGIESIKTFINICHSSYNKSVEKIINDRIESTILDYIPKWVKKRIEIGVPIDAITFISVGELNGNKNNAVVIEALKKIDNPDIHYIICGTGPLEFELKEKALNIKDRTHFLGYRNDIKDLLAASDFFIMPSFREGLSRSLMEALCTNLPCIVSDIRGNRDLILNGQNGYLVDPNSVDGFIEAINKSISSQNYITPKGIDQNVTLDSVTSKIKEIYEDCIY